MFCKKCGKEIKENQKFCTNCGNEVSTERIEKQDLLNQNSKEGSSEQDEKQDFVEKNESVGSEVRTPKNRPQVNSIKFNKKQKLGALIAAIMIIIGISGYKVGVNLTSKEKTIEKFTQALVEGNADELLKYVVSADPNLEITSDNLQVTLDYLSENKYYINEIVSSLHSQASELNKSDEEYESTSMFKLKKQGKKLNIFDNYVIEIKPVYAELSTNLEGTDLYIEEELICTSDKEYFSKEVGPYMPGMYKMKAIHKGKYATLEYEELVDLYDEYKYVDLYVEQRQISVMSDYKYNDAKVFINDIDTETKISDAFGIGPINEGAQIYAIKNVDGKEIKSEEVIYNGEFYIYLKFPESIEETN